MATLIYILRIFEYLKPMNTRNFYFRDRSARFIWYSTSSL